MEYLVSVFMGGKCVHSYFSNDLDDLVTITALYKGCDLSIYNLIQYRSLKPDEIYEEVVKSRQRWKESFEKHEETPPPPPPEITDKPKPQKRIKYWKRPVVCMETGQVFGSVRECSDHIGLPYMTITNCIKNKNATRGLHFAIVETTEEDTEDE